MCLMKHLKICECPPSEPILDLRPSPMDCFGFQAKCCCCIPLKPAVIIIGILTVFWATLQLQSADKNALKIFSEKNLPFTCLKVLCISAAVLLLLSCGILFLGIAMNKFGLINIFVWYGFMYNCLSVAMVTTAFVLKILKIEKKIMKHIIRLILALTWNCFDCKRGLDLKHLLTRLVGDVTSTLYNDGDRSVLPL